MRVDIPVLQRCCFCLPLRGGLIAWAYFKVITMSLFLCYLLWTLLEIITYSSYMHHIYTFYDFAPYVVILPIVITDVILQTIFVVGGHKKNVKLLKIYYYYSLTLFVLTALLGVFAVGVLIYEYQDMKYIYSEIILTLSYEILTLLLSFLIQGYLLILVKSEIIKLSDMSRFKFLNNAASADQCTLKIESFYKQKETANYNILEEI